MSPRYDEKSILAPLSQTDRRPTTSTITASRQVRLVRPSEPILLPKLRIGFADFPYLHSSIDKSLHNSET